MKSRELDAPSVPPPLAKLTTREDAQEFVRSLYAERPIEKKQSKERVLLKNWICGQSDRISVEDLLKKMNELENNAALLKQEGAQVSAPKKGENDEHDD